MRMFSVAAAQILNPEPRVFLQREIAADEDRDGGL